MKYPVIQNFKKKGRRTVKGKRHKYEYRCSCCKKWFKDKDISVDHIVPAGSLKNYDDLPGFVERLFCEEDNLQILCKDKCHQAKTNKERGK